MTFKNISRGWQGKQVSSFGNFRRDRKANNPEIINNGLAFYVDGGNPLSYTGTGTTWTDLGSGADDAALTNGPTYGNTNNGFIAFDGVNDSAVVTDPAALKNQNFTISVWVYPETQNQALTSMMDFEHSNGNGTILQGWVIQSEDATTNRFYYMTYYTGSAFVPTTAIGAGKGLQITNGVWQNLTYTKNGTAVVGYRNGVQIYSATASSGTVSYLTDKNLAVGGAVNFNLIRFFKGNFSNVQIYSRGLSGSEVLQNFNAMRVRFGV
jgi:hypothetical protein